VRSLFAFIAAVALVAFTAGRFRPGAWYDALARPTWTPPDWLFAPVWSVLYLAMAVAGWLVWRALPGSRLHVAVFVWVAQLLLNASWSWIFFGLHQPGPALLDILLLLALIVWFISAASRVSSAAAWLFVPYLLWVGFATALNAAIWHLNRTRT
jgi:tryptophan-rich sensory protein